MTKKKPKKTKLGAADEGWAAPNLTALMDILSNLIFFLMASFGAQTLELTSAAGVSLPMSTSELSVRQAISVAVGMEGLYVEDQLVEKLSGGTFSGRSELATLEQALRRVRALHLAKNELPKDEDEIILFVADKRLEHATLDLVLRSCARAGFPKFRFVVSKT